VTGDSSRAAWLRQARSYLHQADPVLARLIDERPEFDPRAWLAELPAMDLYGALLFQVTGQQLSVPATRRTLARIEALFGGHLPSPAELLAVDPGQLREAGLSWRKIATLRDLAERMSDGRLDPEVLSGLPDDELMAQLTTISGIGPWTVQGALLIALGREDVVLPGDLALRKAVQAAYQLGHLPTQEEVLAIGPNQLSPQTGLACLVILTWCQRLLSWEPVRKVSRSPRRPARSPPPDCRRRGWCWSTAARSRGTGADARVTPAACCRWAHHRRRTSAIPTLPAGAMRPPTWSRRWRSTAGSAT
jgi:DNA-3-methyladenine glycosylase II